MTFWAQIGRHSVAIISLIVALTALSYNTWRNELTEQNRNTRSAGFEMLLHIGELQSITYLAHYDNDKIAGSPRKGWAEVLMLRDLAALMPESSKNGADALHSAWESSWSDLGAELQAVETIEDAIDNLRMNVVRDLESLD